MRLGLLRTLISIASVPVRLARVSPNTPLVRRIHAQITPGSLTPALWRRKRLRDCEKRCPDQAGACCRGKKYEHPTKPLDPRIPCREMCKCPRHKTHWDQCDPWKGTRRSKKAKFYRKMAKRYPQRRVGWGKKRK